MKLNKEKVKFIVDNLGRGWTAYGLSKQYEVSMSRIYRIKRKALISGTLPGIGRNRGDLENQ